MNTDARKAAILAALTAADPTRKWPPVEAEWQGGAWPTLKCRPHPPQSAHTAEREHWVLRALGEPMRLTFIDMTVPMAAFFAALREARRVDHIPTVGDDRDAGRRGW